jgi:hypothetical protein
VNRLDPGTGLVNDPLKDAACTVREVQCRRSYLQPTLRTSLPLVPPMIAAMAMSWPNTPNVSPLIHDGARALVWTSGDHLRGDGPADGQEPADERTAPTKMETNMNTPSAMPAVAQPKLYAA